MNKSHLSFEAKFATSNDETGVLKGYGAVYGNVDGSGDVIAPGAFAKSIKDKAASNSKKFPFLYQHDWADPIGTIEEISEDRNGLSITVKLTMDVQRARDAYALIKQGALTGFSVGFQTIKEEYDAKGTRIIKEAKLWEVSAVTFPCNEQARIESVKGNFQLPDRNITTLDACISQLNTVVNKDSEGEMTRSELHSALGSISSLLSSLKSDTSAHETTEPQQDDGGASPEALDPETGAETGNSAEPAEPQEVKSEPVFDLEVLTALKHSMDKLKHLSR